MIVMTGLVGEVFGRLTVLEASLDNKWGHACWRCLCTCGSIKVVRECHLKNGRTTSYGCYQKETSKHRNRTHGYAIGGKLHKLYALFYNVRSRCSNTNNEGYPGYGGRGIKLFPLWENNPLAFIHYVEQLDNCGKVGYSLDRIDNDGNYEPGNLRWATQKQQNSNKRTNISVDKVEFIKDKLKNSCLSLRSITRLAQVGWGTVQKVKADMDTNKGLVVEDLI